jgi:hypothetical protein
MNFSHSQRAQRHPADDGDPFAAPLGQPAGGDLAGRPGANDDYVELAFHVMSPRLLVVTEDLFM